MEGGVGVAEVVVVMRWGREGSKGGMGKVVRRGGGGGMQTPIHLSNVPSCTRYRT